MTDQLFERLLFEEEGTGIDFKKEQYRFAKASEEERSELVKDVLGSRMRGDERPHTFWWASKRFEAGKAK